MDTTVKYVKMCEKAEEIQKRKPRMFTVTMNNLQRYSIFESMKMNHFGKGICCDGYSGNWWCISRKYDGRTVWEVKEDGFIWLPRQDQLQEIRLKDSAKDFHYILGEFADWHEENFVNIFSKQKLTSMEQLWLAFVMEKEYKKIWNREEWINE